MLAVDASLLEGYSDIDLQLEHPGRMIYLLDKRYILKLYTPVIDVDAIVRMMRLASKVVPVPRVHKHGRSGNCCYILMDYVSGKDIFDPAHLENYPLWAIEAKLEYQMQAVVKQLQKAEIWHHDLFSHNVLLDRYFRVAAVIDWDFAREEPCGDEYLRRVADHYRTNNWNYMFARSHPFGNGFVASPVDGAAPYEPNDPYLPNRVYDTNVEHVLDPLSIPATKPARKRLVVLDGRDGTLVP